MTELSERIEAAARALAPDIFAKYDRELASGRLAENGKLWADVAYKAHCDLVRGSARAALLAADRLTAAQAVSDVIDIVFDGPPNHESGRFVEVEDGNGSGIKCGE